MTNLSEQMKRPEPEPPWQPLPMPEVIEPEHRVEPHELPRGPRSVADRIDENSWEAEWWRSRSERLSDPARGGEAFGLRFASLTTLERGWACWVAGKFEGAYLYTSRRAIVPRKLKAAELKALFSGEET